LYNNEFFGNEDYNKINMKNFIQEKVSTKKEKNDDAFEL